MPSDEDNLTNDNIATFLREYRLAPSDALQQKLIEFHLGLIRETIISFPISLINQIKFGDLLSADVPHIRERRVSNSIVRERRSSDRELMEVGKQGLKKALTLFDPEINPDFSAFARSHVQQHLENFLQRQHLDNRNEPQEKEEVELVATPTRRQETLEILQAYRAKPSTQLRNQLVNLNIGLVRREAYHWKNQCQESFEDLMQVGSIGLINAIERFDVSKGNAFSSFAVPYIKGEIQHYLRDKSPTVRMPRAWLTVYNQGCKIIRNKRTETGREPSSQEVANELGITVHEWYDIKLACQNRSPISLDTPIDQSEDSSTSIGDLVTDQKYQSFQLAQEDNIRLQQALDLLEDRTREVVEFVFLKEFTHREVAETLGISAVTVSRQLKKGLIALKKILATPIEYNTADK
jgi:RNA polymerase sigma-B factor